MPISERNGKWYWGSKGPFDSRKKAEEVQGQHMLQVIKNCLKRVREEAPKAVVLMGLVELYSHPQMQESLVLLMEEIGIRRPIEKIKNGKLKKRKKSLGKIKPLE